MSVSVQHLSKIFGSQKAVDDLNFESRPGEVLGFLGPNGAGKSTTMKIISCFLPQSGGTVEVNGIDTRKDPMAVKHSIGYLPENNPLYTEMYVKEYLNFAARLHGMKRFEKRIKEMITLTG